MKLWIPKEKVANRLKLQIISSLHYFSSLPLSQTANFFTLKILPKQVKGITHYCTMTYKKKEMFIALLTCYRQKYISTAALNQDLSELFSYCPDAQVESVLAGQ